MQASIQAKMEGHHHLQKKNQHMRATCVHLHSNQDGVERKHHIDNVKVA